MTITTNRTPDGCRRDVWNLAVKLAAAAGLSALAVYFFLMDTGRILGRNPRGLTFVASNGMVSLESDPANYFVMVCDPADYLLRPGLDVHHVHASDYWYDMIMDRQEKYLAD